MSSKDTQNKIKYKITDYEGYHDGFYWDMTFHLLINEVPFTYLDVGSGSGWIEQRYELARGDKDMKDRLCSEELTAAFDESYINTSVLEMLYNVLICDDLAFIVADEDFLNKDYGAVDFLLEEDKT